MDTLAFLEHLFDDEPMGDYGGTSWRYWQDVVNGDFPPLPLPGQNVAEPILVIARVSRAN